jgi:hypothetical protein
VETVLEEQKVFDGEIKIVVSYNVRARALPATTISDYRNDEM